MICGYSTELSERRCILQVGSLFSTDIHWVPSRHIIGKLRVLEKDFITNNSIDTCETIMISLMGIRIIFPNIGRAYIQTPTVGKSRWP